MSGNYFYSKSNHTMYVYKCAYVRIKLDKIESKRFFCYLSVKNEFY